MQYYVQFVYIRRKGVPTVYVKICNIDRVFDVSRNFPEFSGISRIFRDFQDFRDFPEFPGFPGFLGFPRNFGEKIWGFFGVSGCNRLYISPKWSILRGRISRFSEISRNFRKFSENVGDFPGISGEKFGGFFRVSGCNRLQTYPKWTIFRGRFPGFSEISEISGKFPKNSRISEFRKSEKFPKFPKISRDGFFSKFSIFFYILRAVVTCYRL